MYLVVYIPPKPNKVYNFVRLISLFQRLDILIHTEYNPNHGSNAVGSTASAKHPCELVLLARPPFINMTTVEGHMAMSSALTISHIVQGASEPAFEMAEDKAKTRRTVLE